MTNKEIKLELAKVALARCSYTDENAFNEAICNLYKWIIEEPEVEVDKLKTEYNDKPICEIIKWLTTRSRGMRYASKLETTFHALNINTIGELVDFGRQKLMRTKGIGKGSVTRIDDALEELYGIKDW